MGLFSKIFGSAEITDEPSGQQRDDVMSSPMVSAGIFKIENGCDEVMGAYGEFGTTNSNPIPVNGIVGQTCYINRLRSKSGVGFFYHRLGNTDSPVTKAPVDIYELVAVDYSEWVTLYLSPYYARRSTFAPEGLSLLSWDDMEELQQNFCKLDMLGLTSRVSNFPMGLVDAISRNKELHCISSGFGKTMANRVDQMLSSYSGKWKRI